MFGDSRASIKVARQIDRKLPTFNVSQWDHFHVLIKLIWALGWSVVSGQVTHSPRERCQFHYQVALVVNWSCKLLLLFLANSYGKIIVFTSLYLVIGFDKNFTVFSGRFKLIFTIELKPQKCLYFVFDCHQ